MRILGFLLVLLAVSVWMPQAAFAKKDHPEHRGWFDKLMDGYWGDKIWEGYDFQPYLGDQPIKNRIVWDHDKWTPQAWIDDVGGDARAVMRDLYGHKILTNQYRDSDRIPVLEVGESFMRLSSTDRIRVLRFVDYVFEITKEENGMFFVYSEVSDDAPLGTYDKRGFQQY